MACKENIIYLKGFKLCNILISNNLFCSRVPCQGCTQIQIGGTKILDDDGHAFIGVFDGTSIANRDQELVFTLVTSGSDVAGSFDTSEKVGTPQSHFWNFIFKILSQIFKKFSNLSPCVRINVGMFVLNGQ